MSELKLSALEKSSAENLITSPERADFAIASFSAMQESAGERGSELLCAVEQAGRQASRVKRHTSAASAWTALFFIIRYLSFGN